MKNIGRKIAARLNEAGIFTEKDLSAVGAIAGVHWDATGEKRKRELKRQVGGAIC